MEARGEQNSVGAGPWPPRRPRETARAPRKSCAPGALSCALGKTRRAGEAPSAGPGPGRAASAPAEVPGRPVTVLAGG